MRRAAKVDRNHAEVVNALRKVGCSVQDLSAVGDGCTDLAVGLEMFAFGRVIPFVTMMEVKDGEKIPSKRKLKPRQQKWHDEWKGHKCVVESVEDALAIVAAIKRGEL